MVYVFYRSFNLHHWTGGWTPRKALFYGLGWMSDAREMFDQNTAGQVSKRPMWFLKETEKERERGNITATVTITSLAVVLCGRTATMRDQH